MDHSHAEDQLHGAVEIIPSRLYYAPLRAFPASDDENDSSSSTKKKSVHYFSIDSELIYWNFFLDYGPLNMGQLYRFCAKLNAKLSSVELRDDIVCFYSSDRGERRINAEMRSNATVLICAYSMIYLGKTLEEAYFGFREEHAEASLRRGGVPEPPSRNCSLPPQSKRIRGDGPFAKLHPLPPFHDASPIVCTYDLTCYDVLSGLDKSMKLGFFRYDNAPRPPPTPAENDPSISSAADNDDMSRFHAVKRRPNPRTFNADEYEYFEQVENGDLNWIVSDKILAFAGPHMKKVVTPEGFCMLTPADYIPYFLKTKVKLVVRLNKRCYDEGDFERAGIGHVEHYYLDGSCPPMGILQSVLADMESIGDDEAMAVHCKAGLGRTGTCIGAYLMKHYRYTAAQAIGWMRLCRPGMVIGPQQHFLTEIESLMWQEGEMYRGNGLRSMSIDFDDGEEEKEDEAPVDLKPVAHTPSNLKAGGVSIVTPEGQPLVLPPTPVEYKLDPASAVSSPGLLNLSSEGEGLKFPQAKQPTVEREGDQANALLSRRLEQYQSRKDVKR